MYLCNQELDHVLHTLLNELIYLGVELFLQKGNKKGSPSTKAFMLVDNRTLAHCRF